MASTQKPPFVKYFIAVLLKDPAVLEKVRPLFVEEWGAIDFEGADHAFDVTDYYEPEMGAPLYRRLLAFEKLAEPGLLADMKLECNKIENQLAVGGKRTVNCDAGYLDHNKVVLASAKEAGQKIYLDKGIYADLAGRYKAGKYQPFEWSFPDFKDGRYDRDLIEIRNKYLDQVKKCKKETA
ncbi:MAG TPA: DUF4416 family protein [Chitinivibrionales bacterium]|nr:DUF4416 family protein [Chitinivibrionales bacterium]